jgi:hypothetical protein
MTLERCSPGISGIDWRNTTCWNLANQRIRVDQHRSPAILALLVLCNALAMPLEQERCVARVVLQDNSPARMGCVSFKSGKQPQ